MGPVAAANKLSYKNKKAQHISRFDLQDSLRRIRFEAQVKERVEVFTFSRRHPATRRVKAEK